MAMVFCRGCAHQLHETAHTCPQCGAPQFAVPAKPQATGSQSSGLGITSLIIGIICLLTLFDDGAWDNESLTGMSMIGGLGLLLGIIGITQNRPANGLAIAGVVMASISLACFLGLFSQVNQL
ncbi:DUF4190 domain-containing protein [Pseudomonas sp. S31]|uniref:DUF4190 domain-containing protein n=1 Tax=Pseudomonas sp. S31 TaxID=1564473 RepID=UPI001913248A|nr:DUF4190 domain-containing protein [Pseudomonas sp. S31]MBK5002443.1 DUF4190 domain-containing protein [Pseudomonas sp. S31]